MGRRGLFYKVICSEKEKSFCWVPAITVLSFYKSICYYTVGLMLRKFVSVGKRGFNFGIYNVPRAAKDAFMTLYDILDGMAKTGVMPPPLTERLKGLEAEKPFAVRRELKALMYLGAILVAAGLAATVKKYFDLLGPWSVLGGLLALFGASVAYCFSRGAPFARKQVASPTLLFDYVLYVGCVAWGLAAAYAETHFHIFGGAWKANFLISSALFFFLAYHFDNRLVLSLGLSSLAAWFGLELQSFYANFYESHRLFALVFGTLAGLAAYFSADWDVKSHFQDVYGNFAGLFILTALLSGAVAEGPSLYFVGLVAACGVTAAHAVSSRKYFYMVYAVLYGYAGVSFVFLRNVRDTGSILLYFMVSSLGVGVGLFVLARRFKEEHENL